MTLKMYPSRSSASSNSSFSHVTSIVEKDNAPSSSGHIRVVVRVRPENSQEVAGNFKTVVRVVDDHMLTFDPQEEGSPDFYHGRRRKARDITKRKCKDMQFAFDLVFSGDTSNEEVYNNTTKGILDSYLDGYNCSVFAYGATGAGKTHTMLGSPEHPGIIFHTMMELYRRIEAMKDDKTCDVAVSYLEVYNEQIRDLLMPTGFLPIREDPEKGAIVTGLSLHKPRSAEELLHMLEFGNKNRTQHPTDANAESSRSHAVFQVFVRQKDRTAGMQADVSVAKMSLIDLAGSERATVTKNMGDRFREGANINRSLLALGNCINALAEGKAKGYVPYRNSKLTRLLKDSLGGNCRTVMIAAVSPSSMSYEDTYNTLKYANRAKNIKATLKRNVVSVDFHVSQYAKIVEDLRQEVSELRTKVQYYEEGGSLAVVKTTIDKPKANENHERIQSVLLSIFQERYAVRRDMMDLETFKRDLLLKMQSREAAVARMSLLVIDSTVVEKATSKLHNYVKSMKRKQHNIKQRKEEIQIRLDSNEHRLQKAQEEMRELAEPGGRVPQVLDQSLRCYHLETELRDSRQHVRCLKRLCRAQERQAQATERLVRALLQTAKKQYLVLVGSNLAASDMISEYDSLQQLVSGQKEVAWADQSGTGSSLELAPGSGEEGQGDKGLLGPEFEELMDMPVMNSVPMTPRRGSGENRAKFGSTPSKTPQTLHTPCSRPKVVHMPRAFTPRHGLPMQPLVEEEHPESQHSTPLATRPLVPEPHLEPQQEKKPKTWQEVLSSEGPKQEENENYKAEPTQSTHTANATFTVEDEDDVVSDVHPLQPSPQETPALITSPCAQIIMPPVTVSTTPSSCAQRESITKIDSGTVTKRLFPVSEDISVVNNEKHRSKNVVRAMDFSSPPGKMSFADVVKTPPAPRSLAVIQSENGVNFSPRSPLMSRENLPDSAFLSQQNLPEGKPRRVTFAAQGAARLHVDSSHNTPGRSRLPQRNRSQSADRNHVLAKHESNIQALQKLGLPSTMDRHNHPSVGGAKQSGGGTKVVGSALPSYMQPTKAVANRHRAYRENSASPDYNPNRPRRVARQNARNSQPRRVLNDENHRPPIRKGPSGRSQSVSAPSSRKWSSIF